MYYVFGLTDCFLGLHLENGFQSKLTQIKKSLARYSSNVCSVTVHVGK